MLGHPGPPLNSLQLRELLDQLYKLADRQPIPTTAKNEVLDIDNTKDATHVYVKVDGSASLAPKFEGPYQIVSRPSRSTIQVKVGMFKSGEPRLLVFHWSSCKVANLRSEAQEASRPKLGRPVKNPVTSDTSLPTPSPGSTPSSSSSTSSSGSMPASTSTSPTMSSSPDSPKRKPRKRQGQQSKNHTDIQYETLSGKKPHPGYLAKGPIFTKEIWDKWKPEYLGLPPVPTNSRPVRTSRNPAPQYLDAVDRPG